MKKTAIAIGFIALAAGALGAATQLRLDKPNGGEVLTLGNRRPIAWTAVNIPQNVKLVLLRGDNTVFGVIARNLAPGGSPYDWAIGQTEAGVAPTGAYRIRVTTMDGSVRDASDEAFTIAAAGGGAMPDFQVSHMGCTPRLVNGAVQRVAVQLYVKNNGADYLGPLAVHFICLDALVNAKVSLDEVVRKPEVNIPHGQWFGFTLCEPAWPAGVRAIHFGVQLDPANQVQETDETNNHFEYSYTLPPLDQIPER